MKLYALALTILIVVALGCSGAVDPDHYDPNDVIIINGTASAPTAPDSEVVRTDAMIQAANTRDQGFDATAVAMTDQMFPDASQMSTTPSSDGQVDQVDQGMDPDAMVINPDAAQDPIAPFLNEIMADPIGEAGIDAVEDTVDWLEIHNPNAMPIDLSGWTLRRTKDEAGVVDVEDSLLPIGTQISANGYLVVWATGEDPLAEGLEPAGPHTSFKLGKAGGILIELLDASGTLVDAVTYPEIKDGSAYAKDSVTGAWAVDETPTRGQANHSP